MTITIILTTAERFTVARIETRAALGYLASAMKRTIDMEAAKSIDAAMDSLEKVAAVLETE